MIENASRICRFALLCGGHCTWELQERSNLWQDRRVRKLASVASHFANIFASAVDWFTIEKNKEVTVKKKLRVWTTDDRVPEDFHPYQFGFKSEHTTFVECRGSAEKRTAHHMKKFAEIYWRSQSGCRVANYGAFATSRLVISSACRGFQTPREWVFGDGHRELDSLPAMPLWCSLITRVIKSKSAEARCEHVAKAIQTELSNENSENVWDTGEVYSSQSFFAIPNSMKRCLARVISPYVTPDELCEDGHSPDRFSSSACSHVAILLFLSRVAHPDISIAVQRLCRVVTKWTTTRDVQLIRLYAYLDTTGPIALRAELSPEDLDELQFGSDADWAGDPEDCKSTSGLLLEMVNPNNGRRWLSVGH